MQVFDCEQGSSEWFDLKRGKVTASHFSDVLNKGSGRKTYMYRVLAERLSGETHPAFSNKAMEDGIEKEPQARAYYEALFGKVEQVGFVQLDEDVGCSPDGLVGDDGLLEIKAPYVSTHLAYIYNNRLPAIYVPQVQGQLLVTDRRWCDFVSYAPTVKARPFWKIRVYRDESFIKELKIRIIMFVSELKEMEKKINQETVNRF